MFFHQCCLMRSAHRFLVAASTIMWRTCRSWVLSLCETCELAMLQINDFLISKDELSHRVALVGATTSMLAGGLVILGFMYHYYAPYANCGLNIFFITWTLIMALVYVALSVRTSRFLATEIPTFIRCTALASVWPCHSLDHIGSVVEVLGSGRVVQGVELQVSPWRAKGAGLLTAAIVFIYTTVSYCA